MLAILLALSACEIGPAGTGAPSPAPSANPADRAGVLFPWVAPLSRPLPQQALARTVVLTEAGSGERGAGGDGASAGNAQMAGPSGIAVAPSGAVYVADASLSVVRRIDPDGLMRTSAGTGARGFSGDGADALRADLTDPSWLLVDATGAIFVVSSGRIRRIGPDGVIATGAGRGESGFGGDGGPAALASFDGASGMAADAQGNLYIADRGNGRVRRIAPDGGITTFAGTGEQASTGDGGPATEASLNGPSDVAVGPDGSIFVAELKGHRVRRIAPDGVIHTVAGNGLPGFSGDLGPAVQASLNGPRSIEVDARGYIYIADWKNRAIRVVQPDGAIDTVAGLASGGAIREGAPALAAAIPPPLDLALGPDGAMHVLFQGTFKVHVLRELPADFIDECKGRPTLAPVFPPLRSGAVAAIVLGDAGFGYGGDGGPANQALFLSPESIASSADGRLFIADTGNHRIRVVSADGTVDTYAGTGDPGYSGDGGPAREARISAPRALLVDSHENLYFFDSGNFRIRRIDSCGNIETIAGTGAPGSGGDGGPALRAELRDPSGLAMDAAGNLYIADPSSNRVRVVAPNGDILAFAGNGEAASGPDGVPAAQTPLDGPASVAIGSDGVIYIAEMRAGKLRAIDGSGTVRTVAGPGAGDAPLQGARNEVRVQEPVSLLVDREGAVYFAQLTAGVVSVVKADGNVSTAAGNPSGKGAPGGDALEVAIAAPLALTLDGGGNLFVLESAGIVWQIGSGDGRVVPLP